MASSNSSEYVMQCKTCRCGEGDNNLWTNKASDNPDKQTNKCPNCEVLKSGPLFISSKGIGWTSWKKRWFVLTRTSLVFFRIDPATLPQKGGEPNATLGGIDLNSSGSVVVKADKKLLTVHFPDGRDGRTFTLKAETSEDLYEWKAALENALAQAPSAALAMGQNGLFQNDITEPIEASNDQCMDKEPAKSSVMTLALEDDDGSPTFLEKALRFIEEYGIKVEGILRQSADVEEVKRRVQEYEQGKVDFSSDEDGHVIGDCIKLVLRESPSSPVPASCCTALVEAYRTDRARRVDAIRSAIYETFPETSLLLVQRILKMMQTVEAHKAQNRMSLSALAACMAPLLLRPLLAGDCEFEDNFNMGGDGSIQLLKAAAAANHAQLIVIILLEEFETVFDEDLLLEGSMSSEVYSDSEEGDVEDDDLTDNDIPEDDGDHDEHNSNDDSTDNDLPEDDEYHDEHNSNDDSTDNDILEDDEYQDGHNGLEADIDDDSEHSSNETATEGYSNVGSDDNELIDNQKRHGASLQDNDVHDASESLTDTTHDTPKKSPTSLHEASHGGVSRESIDDIPTSPMRKSSKVAERSMKSMISVKRRTVWGRTPARKNLSMESIDLSSEDEVAIQKLEKTKNDLQNKISKEAKGNAVLQGNLERRKEALRERRLALERDVERLREQLQSEKDLKASLESGLMNMRPGHVSFSSAMDSKTRADLEEVALAEADIVILKQKVADLRGQLKQSYASLCESCGKHLYSRDHSAEKDQLEDVRSVSLDDQREKVLKKADASSGVKEQESESPVLSGISRSGEPRRTTRNTISKNSTSGGENNVAANCNNVETQSQESAAPSNASNKFCSSGEDARKGGLDSPSTCNQSLIKQWPSNTTLKILKSQAAASGSSSEEQTGKSEAAKSSSSRPEEISSSASALSKLTNRLNFLKERRAHLVSELQNIQTSHPSGPEGPPPPATNS